MEISTIILLYLGGLVLIATEAFMPGMILGLTGLTLVGISVYHGIGLSVWLGLGQIAVTMVFIPFVIYMAIRQLSLKRTLATEEGVTSVGDGYSGLHGKTGKTLNPLRPAGTIVIDQKRYDVVTEGDLIEAGVDVRVIKVEGNRIVVKRI